MTSRFTLPPPPSQPKTEVVAFRDVGGGGTTLFPTTD